MLYHIKLCFGSIFVCINVLERLNGEKYDASADIWSAGLSIVQIANKRFPFTAAPNNPIDLLYQIEQLDFSSLLDKRKFSQPMRECVLSMLQLDAARRASSMDLTAHDWFTHMRVNELTAASQVSYAVISCVHLHRYQRTYMYIYLSYL